MISATSISVESRLKIENRKADGIRSYDIDNYYPQRVSNIISNSGTATSCINIFAKFLIGDGFTDKQFWKAKVNEKGLTVDQLYRAICYDFAKFKGFAIHVGYNALLEKSEFNYIPFEKVRLGESDDKEYSGKVVVYDSWGGRRIDKKKIQTFNIYNPQKDIVKYQIEKAGVIENYKGQIFYFGGAYQKASLDSVLEDVQTDYEIKQFRLNTVVSGFLGSHMFEIPYPQEDEDAEALNETIKSLCGSQGAGKSIVVENPALKEGYGIKITKFENQNYDRQYESTVRTVKDSIIECLGIPPILLGVAVAGKLGTSGEVRDAFAFYNNYTLSDRNSIVEAFIELFSGTNINASKDFSVSMLNFVMQSDESLINKIGIGGVTALTAILQSTEIAFEQKVNILVITFGLTREQAVSMIAQDIKKIPDVNINS